MDINVGDRFIWHSTSGIDYKIEIVNINDFREPDMRYALDVWDSDGKSLGDVIFTGDDFF